MVSSITLFRHPEAAQRPNDERGGAWKRACLGPSWRQRDGLCLVGKLSMRRIRWYPRKPCSSTVSRGPVDTARAYSAAKSQASPMARARALSAAKSQALPTARARTSTKSETRLMAGTRAHSAAKSQASPMARARASAKSETRLMAGTRAQRPSPRPRRWPGTRALSGQVRDWADGRPARAHSG